MTKEPELIRLSDSANDLKVLEFRWERQRSMLVFYLATIISIMIFAITYFYVQKSSQRELPEDIRAEIKASEDNAATKQLEGRVIMLEAEQKSMQSLLTSIQDNQKLQAHVIEELTKQRSQNP